MNTAYTAHAVSDLYSAGHSCDGHPYIAECFYVIVENARGTRFRHVATFRGAEALFCEETGEPSFADLREEASAKADRLAARVNAAIASGKGIDWAYWVEIDPAYGSDEYQAQGIEAQRAFADRN
jgi:hypothetical protein